MDFALSQEQSILRDSARRFCRTHYAGPPRSPFAAGRPFLDRSHWREIADLGWLGVGLSAEGDGAGAIDMAVLLEEIGRALCPLPLMVNAVLAGRLLEAAQESEADSSLLSSLTSGETIVAVALDATGVQSAQPDATAARASDGSHILQGRKTLVLGAADADLIVVAARTSGVAGQSQGLSLFAVAPDAPGLTRQSYILLDGSPAADLTLDNVRALRAIGRDGEACAAIASAVDHAILALSAEAIGVMTRLLNDTVKYLKGRRQYGAALSSYQALQHRAADMLIEVELSRSMLYRALAFLNRPEARAEAVAACKYQVSRSAKAVGAAALQLHGAIGMADQSIAGQGFKRLRTLAGLFGDADHHLERLAALAFAG